MQITEVKKDYEYGETEDFGFVNGKDECMIMDRINGKTERWYKGKRAIGPVKDALKYVKGDIGREDRLVIIKLTCIIGVKKVKKDAKRK